LKLTEIQNYFNSTKTIQFAHCRTRPVSDQKLGLGLGLAGLVLCCERRSSYARRHIDLEILKDTATFQVLFNIYSFSILCLENHYCGDQKWVYLLQS